jgi:hypothetical protein
MRREILPQNKGFPNTKKMPMLMPLIDIEEG